MPLNLEAQGWVDLESIKTSPGKAFAIRSCDLDADGYNDIIFFIDFKFKNGPAPEEMGMADCDGNGTVNIMDIIRLIKYKFKGGLQPACQYIPRELLVVRKSLLSKGRNFLYPGQGQSAGLNRNDQD